jgi:chromosome partitioning protein
MIVISVANPKGGSGKTTTSLILAEFFSAAGKSVVVIDNDPTQNLMHWMNQREARGASCPFKIVPKATPDDYDETLDELSKTTEVCIVDTEGVKDLMSSVVTMSSDLVLIPLQASPMDARNAAAQLSIILLAERHSKRTIPYRFVFTRTNATIATRLFKAIEAEMDGMPVAKTHIVERAAYKHMHEDGYLLGELDPLTVSGLPKAEQNAIELVNEISQIIIGCQNGK